MARRQFVRIRDYCTSLSCFTTSLATTIFVGLSLVFVLSQIDKRSGDTVLEYLRPVTTTEQPMISKTDQLRLKCEGGNSKLYLTSTDDGHVLSVDSGDRCFSRALRNYCPNSSGWRVPNIVHYVWFGIEKMTFYQYVSFLSVIKFQKPCVILVHGNIIPTGHYWRRLVRQVSNVIHVEMSPQKRAKNGKIIATGTHKSNIARLMVLKEYGGVYLDLDTVLLRSLGPLMNYPVTMSLEYPWNLWNGLIVAERDPLFIRHWITLFNEKYYYTRKKYFEFSLYLPTRIAKAHPSWIHVENTTFCTPNGKHKYQIFDENFDWKDNYAMHLYIRFYKKNDDVTSVRKLNTTLGALARLVLYGTKDLLED